jgi:hypothetical protein
MEKVIEEYRGWKIFSVLNRKNVEIFFADPVSGTSKKQMRGKSLDEIKQSIDQWENQKPWGKMVLRW